jgi:hypothetical protein
VLRIAALAALVAVAAAISLAVSREARDAVADFLGLGVSGERIEITEPTPTPADAASPDPTATPLPRFEAFAQPVTLEEARAAVSFDVLAPPKTPIEAVFLLRFLGLDGVVLRTELYDFWQFEAGTGIYLGKGGTAVLVEEVTVSGRFAYWVTGGPRVLSVVDATGRPLHGVSIETDAHALVWERDGVTYRIEGDLVREQAIAIAEALE